MKQIIALSMLVCLAAGCAAKSKPAESAPASSLPGKTWSLTMLEGKEVPAAQDRRHPSLRFDAGTRRVSGYAGVNQFGGTYTLDGQKLTFGPLAMTRMAGPPEAMELETRFSNALGATTGWRIEGGDLQLLAGDRVIARFKPVAQP